MIKIQNSKINYKKYLKILKHNTSVKKLQHLYDDLVLFDKDFESFLISDIEYLYLNRRNNTVPDCISTLFKEAYNETTRKYLAEAYLESGIETCPYCNTAFIGHKIDGNKFIQFYEFDHIFDKDTYPLYSVCLFNLLPVCHNCNHKKGNQSIFMPPTHKKYDQKCIKFTYNVDKNVQYKINLEGYKRFFEITKCNVIYESKPIMINELLEKVKIYNDSYRNDLSKILGKHTTEAELKALIFGTRPDDKDLIKQPFSKFKRDILEELGIW